MTGGIMHTPSHTNVCKFHNFQLTFSQLIFHLKCWNLAGLLNLRCSFQCWYSFLILTYLNIWPPFWRGFYYKTVEVPDTMEWRRRKGISRKKKSISCLRGLIKKSCLLNTGFVHFFVNRIQDFFQTFSRPFFLFSRLKITVKFFMAREEIIVLIMKTTNKKRKKTVSAV